MVAVRLLQRHVPASVAVHVLRPPMTKPADEDWGALMLAAQAGNGGAYRRLLTELQVMISFGGKKPALVSRLVTIGHW